LAKGSFQKLNHLWSPNKLRQTIPLFFDFPWDLGPLRVFFFWAQGFPHEKNLKNPGQHIGSTIFPLVSGPNVSFPQIKIKVFPLQASNFTRSKKSHQIRPRVKRFFSKPSARILPAPPVIMICPYLAGFKVDKGTKECRLTRPIYFLLKTQALSFWEFPNFLYFKYYGFHRTFV